MRLKSIILLCLLGCWALGAQSALAQSELFDAVQNAGRFNGRPLIRTRAGNGIGYRHGYTALGGMVPLRQMPGDFLTFADMRFLIDYDGRLGGNFGIGHRIYSPAWDRTFGGYLYIDGRNTSLDLLTQLTLGFESLGQTIDWRANAYVPVGNRLGEAQLFTPTGPAYLTGHRIMAPGLKRFDQAMTGCDFLAAYTLPAWSDVRLTGGGYWFTGSGTSDALGYRAGVDWQATDYLNFDATAQGDQVFGDNVWFTASFTWPGRRRARDPLPASAATRLHDPVDRLEMIVVSEQTRAGNYSFTDPRSEQAINLIYVDESAPAGGNGTYESPFNTMADVQNAIAQYDIIFAYDGSYTDPLVLFNDQRLLGDGTVHEIDTMEVGLITFPEYNAGAQPTFFGIAGAAVTIGRRNEVSGIYIDGNMVDDSQGIFGNSSDNYNINRNYFSNIDTEAIEIQDAEGVLNRIVDNTFTNILNDAIQLETDGGDMITVLVQGNVINGASNHGIKLEIDDDSIMNATIIGNTISNTNDNGVQVEFNSTAASTIVINNNTITKITGSTDEGGINVVATAGHATIEANNNTINLADGDIEGLTFITTGDARITATASGNVISGTHENSIHIQQGSTAASSFVFSNNTFTKSQGGTSEGAIRVDTTAGSTTLSVLNNTFTLNDNDIRGLLVNTTGTGSATVTASGNTLATNYGMGFEFLHTGTGTVNASILNNTFSDTGGGNTNATILFDLNGGVGSVFNATVDSNSITTANVNPESIRIATAGNTTANISLTNNTIGGTFDNAIEGTFNGNSNVNLTIRGNTITGNASTDNGILLTANNTSLLDLLVELNTITGNDEEGIRVVGTGTSTITARLFNNTVTGNGTAAAIRDIEAQVSGFATLLLDVRNNTVGDMEFTNNSLNAVFNIDGNPDTDNTIANPPVIYSGIGTININTNWNP